ncbi:MAG TPA: hypothetical protein VD710_10925 [Nitrososphaeraceae archaeon]|nr:hypothetical protein [Nitrososphaeraceae archaeon]
MTRDLIVRGFDDKVHTDLGRIAKQKGVSINSIVKDAVDIWLKRKQEILKKHHLIIYSDDKDMLRLLKSMDRLADESDLFKSFCGAPSSPYAELLSKMKWYNGTIMPYYYSNNIQNGKKQDQQHNERQTPSQKDIMKYCGNVMTNIANNANNKQLCCMDFLINDVAKTSLRQALDIEEAYDNNRLSGLMYCTYKTENLLNSEIKNIIELFELHDQVFILKNDEIYKLHVTKENVHKLFLN